jgi:HEPN domain-containing protein
MDRKDLRALSRVRLSEARALFKAGLPDGAYYLAGYAVECALKACIAKETQRYEFPEKSQRQPYARPPRTRKGRRIARRAYGRSEG